MATSNITQYLTSNAAATFARTITNANNVYLAIGTTNQGLTVSGSDAEIASAMNNIIGAVKINEFDVAISAPRKDWTSGVVYRQYNAFDYQPDTVMTVVGTARRVYKCLYNNKGASSTSTPSGTATTPFKTADGYHWQFMWEIDPQTASKFITPTTIPVVISANVTAAAVSQSIDTVNIDDAGRGYNNFFGGTLGTGDIESATTFRLPGTASNVSDFYKGCIVEIVGNPGSPSFGEFRTITGYNGTSRTVTVDVPFTNVQINDQYAIRPKIVVTGSTSANNAVISAVIEGTGNTVIDTIIHKRGSNHADCVASVGADASVGITRAAAITVHPAPVEGHGGNVVVEASGNLVTIAKMIANTSPVVANVSTFETISVLSAPTLNNIVLTGSGGSMAKFEGGEKIVAYQPKGTIAGVGTISTNTLTGTGTNLDVFLSSGDQIAVANSTAVSFATVINVINSTSASITGAAPISGAISVVDINAIGQVSYSNTEAVALTSVPTGMTKQINKIAGLSSGAYNNTSPYVISDSTVMSNDTLVKNTGSILYLNNNPPINIASNKTISVVVSFSF